MNWILTIMITFTAPGAYESPSISMDNIRLRTESDCRKLQSYYESTYFGRGYDVKTNCIGVKQL